MIAHRVSPGVPVMPLDRYLRRAYPLLNTASMIKNKSVKVNGARPENGKAPVRPGDEIVLYASGDFSLRVAGEKDGLLAVVKPQGLPVAEDADGINVDTVLSRARLFAPDARLCHRLDAQTGGVLLLATNERAYEAAVRAFRDRQVEKRYVALTGGAYEKPEGVYRDFLIKDASRARVRIVRGGKNALPVETRWRVLERADDGITRVELEPVTGRTHQLRAHMAHHGHPLLGDDQYGDRALNKDRRMTRLCLWCASIRLMGCAFEADPPDWLGGKKRNTAEE